MSRSIALIVVFALLLPAPAMILADDPRIPQIGVRGEYIDHGPLSGLFMENRGFYPGDVLFKYMGSPSLFVHNDGISVLDRSGSPIYRMRVRDASPGPSVHGSGEGPLINYYAGNDPSTWLEGVKTYRSVSVNDILEGADLVLKNTDQGLKWDLLLERGSMISAISMEYSGDIRLDPRGSEILIRSGRSTITEGPFVFLQDGEEVPGEPVIDGKSIDFQMESFDPSSPLTIDPLITDSTYIGGTLWDTLPSMDPHPSGDIVVSSTTESNNIFSVSGGHDTNFNGNTDLFICRMSSDLSSMKYATYFGGSGYDTLLDSVSSENGNIHLVGKTTSTDMPTTADAVQGSYNGGNHDGFYVNLSSDLGTLSYSTYIGGSSNENATGVDVSPSGNVFIAGSTSSSDLPSTTGVYQENLRGVADGFVLKLSGDQSSLDFLTYIGGDGFGDQINDMMVDGKGRPVVVGYTVTPDYPTTKGAFRNGTAYYMSFVTRFTADGTDLHMSTFLAQGTYIYSLFISDAIYLTGRTYAISGEFPVSPDAFDRDLTGKMDGYVTKMALNGSTILASTFLGHNEEYLNPPENIYLESCTDIFVEPEGSVAVTGYTDSRNFPVTADAHDINRSELDAFVTIFDENLTFTEYSTFLGGYEEEKGTDVLILDNWLYVTGHTYDDQMRYDFPTTEGAFDTTHNQMYDLFLTRYKLDTFLPGPPSNLSAFTANTTVNLTWSPPEFDGNEEVTHYRLYRGPHQHSMSYLNTTADTFYSDTGLEKGKTYNYQVRAVNIVGEGPPSATSATPYTVPGPPSMGNRGPGANHINITWYPPADRGGTLFVTYNIYIGTSPDNLTVSVEGINRTWYDLTGLTNGIRYFFGITAVNHVGEGPMSDIGNSTPLGRPTPPMNLTATPSSGAATLNWEEPMDKGGSPAVFYTIYRYVNESYQWDIEVGVQKTSFRVEGLENGKNYTFYVTASNLLGEGYRSALVDVTPLGRLSEPYNLTGQEFGDRVLLRWSSPNYTGNSRSVDYTVLMGEDPENLTPVAGTTNTTISILDLVPGTDYYFNIEAFNGLYKSTGMSVLHLRPLKLPSAPGAPTAKRGDSFIMVNWTPPDYIGGSTIISYTVHMGKTPRDILPVETTVGTAVNLTGLENGRNYFITIRAVNEKGPGPYSPFVNATPMSVPSEPLRFTYDTDDGSIALSWDPPFDNGGSTVITYTIFMGGNRTDMRPVVDDIVSRNHSLIDLVNGREYFLGVTANNVMGSSSMAGPVNAVPMTYPEPPEIINISIADQGLRINWEPPEDNGGSDVWYYYIYREDVSGKLQEIGDVGGHVTFFIDTEAVPGDTYTYAVRAVTSFGQSELSGSSSFEYEKEKEETDKGGLMLIISAAAVSFMVLFLVLLFFVMNKRRTKRDMRMWEE